MAFHNDHLVTNEDDGPSPVPLGDFDDIDGLVDMLEEEHSSMHSVLSLSDNGRTEKFVNYYGVDNDSNPGELTRSSMPNARKDPPPPIAIKSTENEVNVETLFTEDELRNAGPADWARIRAQRTKRLRLSKEHLREIARLRRKKRGCVHAKTQRDRRVEKSRSLKDQLIQTQKDLKDSRCEVARLRQELADLHELIQIFNGASTE